MKRTVQKFTALAAGLALIAIPARASWDSGKVSSQAVTSRAAQALAWVKGQMAANDHHLVSGFTDENNNFQTFDDAGLTIDGLLALAAGGMTNDGEAQAGKAWMADNVDAYVTGSDPNSLYAGALGKAIVFAVVYDVDFNDVDGRDLEADLRGRMQPNGRFTDKATDFQTGEPADFSNGIGAAFDVLALAGTDDGVPAVALDYLLLQQCPNGGFRAELGDAQCTDNAQVDVDATSFALTALGAVIPSDDAIDAGIDYLRGAQVGDGSFEANANSTGLAGVTMRAFGAVPDANDAADFVKTIQLTGGADAGAILVDEEAYDAAVADGLDEQGRTLAARATTQGVLALGLPAYPLIGERPPVEPSTTIAVSPSSVAPGGTMTVDGGGFYAGEKVDVIVTSDPVTVGSPTANESGALSFTFTLPASVGPGQHTVTLRGQESAETISAPFTVTSSQVTSTTAPGVTPTLPRPVSAPSLVRTGTGSSDSALIAFGCVLLGGALMLSTRRRRIVYPFKK